MGIPRILEPEVMDTAEDANAYDMMDHRQVNELFVQDLLQVRSELGDVLDLGTGTAQLPIVLCEQHASCRVMAVDLSIEMLEQARFNLEAAGQTERIVLDHIDAKTLPYSEPMFDTTMSNSIVHHIPEPITVIREAVRVTKPGGTLFFRDLLRPESEAELNHLVTTYAADCNDYQQRLFRESLHAALTIAEMGQLVESLGFAANTVTATSDRHWTWVAQRPTPTTEHDTAPS